jgi:hypothetical protein
MGVVSPLHLPFLLALDGIRASGLGSKVQSKSNGSNQWQQTRPLIEVGSNSPLSVCDLLRTVRIMNDQISTVGAGQDVFTRGQCGPYEVLLEQRVAGSVSAMVETVTVFLIDEELGIPRDVGALPHVVISTSLDSTIGEVAAKAA